MGFTGSGLGNGSFGTIIDTNVQKLQELFVSGQEL